MGGSRGVVTALLVLGIFAAGAAPGAVYCPRREGFAATLLFPYFEVDLDGTRTTLLAIGNSNRANAAFTPSPDHALVRVTLWTDWAIPTLSFDLYLRRGAVQTINLRDIFLTGSVPVTHPPPGVFPGCGSTLGGQLAVPSTLQTQHTGRPTFNFCFASPRSDTTLATGYATVDVVNRCSESGTNPTRPNYFGTVISPASNDNRLFGDFMLVDPTQNFASGQQAVALHASRSAFGAGDYTFYGRYVGFRGTDKRRPLSSTWGARYLTGGAFDGGTQLLVWRDTKSASTAARACGGAPGWAPLGEANVVAIDEQGARRSLGTPSEFFDVATQRVDVRSALHPPADFGWLSLSLAHRNGSQAQAWVGTVASAQNRFSAGFSATPLIHDPCSMRP